MTWVEGLVKCFGNGGLMQQMAFVHTADAAIRNRMFRSKYKFRIGGRWDPVSDRGARPILLLCLFEYITFTSCSWQFGISDNDRIRVVDGTYALHAARWPSIQDYGYLA